MHYTRRGTYEKLSRPSLVVVTRTQSSLADCRATTRERGLHKLVTLLAASFAYEEALVRSAYRLRLRSSLVTFWFTAITS